MAEDDGCPSLSRPALSKSASSEIAVLRSRRGWDDVLWARGVFSGWRVFGLARDVETVHLKHDESSDLARGAETVRLKHAESSGSLVIDNPPLVIAVGAARYH